MNTPDTIVLIHGFWVTPRSWEHWKTRYEAKGFTVHTPAYPGFEVEVEALRDDPTPIADLTIEAIVAHLEAFLDTLDTTPILMGHSAGGAFMQVVMDHGYGCAGVGLNSAPTEGVRVTPWTQLHSVFPVLKNPLNHHRAVGFDARAVEVRLHQHLHRRGVAGVLRALPHPRLRSSAVRLGAGQLQARPPGRLGRLQEPEPSAAAVPVRLRGPHHAAGRAGLERQALQGRGHHHRARDLRRSPAPDGRRRRLGGDRRPGARMGARARRLDARRRPRSTPDQLSTITLTHSADRPR